jgi:hypothetical protein
VNPHALPALAVTAALALTSLSAAQAPKKPGKPKEAAAAMASPKPVAEPPAAKETAAPLAKSQVVRSAACTLTLQGRTDQAMTLGSKAGKAKRTKHVLQEFNFVLPGQLTETVHPDGQTEFTFTPSASLAQAPAEGNLHLEDDFPAPGWAPVAVDATRLQNAGPMVFKALARGQNIFPLGGAVVNLKGRLSSLAAMTATQALGETENRPVAATPMPLTPGELARPAGLPVLRFEGVALWAWANSPGGLTLRGVIDYQNTKSGSAIINGKVNLGFKIAPLGAGPK